jgi:hypothetical protein
MSYSLNCKCPKCKKKKKCVDSSFVQAAISGIHSVNWANGAQEQPHHLGCGSIEINCINFENEETPVTDTNK